MISRRLIATAALLFVSMAGMTQAHAAPVCFTDVPSFNNVRAQLPAFMQPGYVYAVHHSSMTTAAFRILATGNVFGADAIGHNVIAGTIKQSGILASICVDGPNIHGQLTNGNSEDFTYQGNVLHIQGYDFQVTDQATYTKTVNDINHMRDHRIPVEDFSDYPFFAPFNWIY